ncbi:hypothetical protein JKP88DRAFT_347319 [Tribonema minus]|uniref:Uncharacterized protein n=1 Tax=Tribonema minus TaxID=303371 RepID=A0A836CRC1_9STRA|nr:hypothetical protein JKP88DRAFT_347319 [Tribonema minus]
MDGGGARLRRPQRTARGAAAAQHEAEDADQAPVTYDAGDSGLLTQALSELRSHWCVVVAMRAVPTPDEQARMHGVLLRAAATAQLGARRGETVRIQALQPASDGDRARAAPPLPKQFYTGRHLGVSAWNPWGARAGRAENGARNARLRRALEALDPQPDGVYDCENADGTRGCGARSGRWTRGPAPTTEANGARKARLRRQLGALDPRPQTASTIADAPRVSTGACACAHVTTSSSAEQQCAAATWTWEDERWEGFIVEYALSSLAAAAGGAKHTRAAPIWGPAREAVLRTARHFQQFAVYEWYPTVWGEGAAAAAAGVGGDAHRHTSVLQVVTPTRTGLQALRSSAVAYAAPA